MTDDNGPLSLEYWLALKSLAEPLELMIFTLTHEGDLPSTGNHPKPADVMVIRNGFHGQLADLWDTHVVMRQLRHTARTIPWYGSYMGSGKAVWPPARLSEYKDPVPPLKEGQTDFCAPIQKGTAVAYVPLVRESLYLTCALDIHFLRYGDPGALVTQGGDLDGRLKALFDALRMPNEAEERAGTPAADPCYCLLESDTLISDLSVKTGRLLGRDADPRKRPHLARLTIDVTVKVLRVMEQNQCLIGD